MTRWQKIVTRIRTRLGDIQQANGFRTDAGLRPIPIDNAADPLRPSQGVTRDTGLVIQIEPAEPADEQGSIRPGAHLLVVFTRQLAVFGFRPMEDRATWFDRAEELEADIKQAVFQHPEDQQFYRQLGLKSIRLGTAESVIPEAGDEFIGVEVALEITYIENLSEPWEP